MRKCAIHLQAPAPQYACVVSVGCGIFPPEVTGDFSIQTFLGMNAGKKVLHVKKILKGTEELLKLFGAAVSVL